MAPQDSPHITPQFRPHMAAGQVVRAMRRAHGLTVRELAEQVGISHTHLVRVESGEREISNALRERIAQTLARLPKGKAS